MAKISASDSRAACTVLEHRRPRPIRSAVDTAARRRRSEGRLHRTSVSERALARVSPRLLVRVGTALPVPDQGTSRECRTSLRPADSLKDPVVHTLAIESASRQGDAIAFSRRRRNRLQAAAAELPPTRRLPAHRRQLVVSRHTDDNSTARRLKSRRKIKAARPPPPPHTPRSPCSRHVLAARPRPAKQPRPGRHCSDSGYLSESAVAVPC